MLWLYLTEFALAVMFVACQFAWPTWLRLFEQPPDLAVILLVVVGLTRGPLEGCWTGLVTALAVGSLGSTPLGGLFVSHMGAGTTLGLLGGRIFPEHLPVAMGVTATAVLVMGVVELLFLPPPSVGPWLAAILSQAVLSGLVAAPLFVVLRQLMHYLLPPAQRRV